MSSVIALCRFVVLRTTILVTEKEAEKMTHNLYTILSNRMVTMVLRQQFVTHNVEAIVKYIVCCLEEKTRQLVTLL